MLKRVLTNWTITRAIYLLMGCFVIVQAILSHQWFGIAFGGYFAAMGLFAFGCASGSSFGGTCETDKPEEKK